MCVCKLHSIICVHSLHIFMSLVAITGFVSCIKYGTQCGETSTTYTLAETQSSVSSVGVQSKGSSIVFLVIIMLVFEK